MNLSTPPSEPVWWLVELPQDIDLNRLHKSRRRAATRLAKLRKIGPMSFAARTWVEARSEAVRWWASLGLIVNPQSVRDGRLA